MTAGALFPRTLALFAFGGLLVFLGARRADTATRRARATKFWGYFAIVHGVLALCLFGTTAVVVLALAIAVGSAREAVGAWRRMPSPRPAWLVALFAVLLGVFVTNAARSAPAAMAWIFIVTAAFDGMSQVVGQLVGRTPLAPAISPAKTVEGALGGAAGALLVGAWFAGLIGGSGPSALAHAGTVAVAALSGDLLGSWSKRRAGIKDFSNAIPGQGGVLDRFGSFIAAVAIAGATR